jgi:outer membrane protein
LKSFIKVLSIAVVFSTAITMATFSGAANAQQKIAVVDVQSVIQGLPQLASIDAGIQAEFGEQIQEIQRMGKDRDFLIEKLQRERATMSEAQIKDLEQQVNDVGRQLQEKGGPLQQNVQRRTEEERRKLFGLIQTAIDNVAKSDGYDIVLNVNAVPYAKEQFDISSKVSAIVAKAG